MDKHIKTLFVVAALLANHHVHAGPELSGYKIAFSDDFNGATLDSSKWKTAPLWGPYVVTNNEEQYYVDIFNSNQGFSWSPFELNNGILTITASPVSDSATPAAPEQPAAADPFWDANPEFQYNPDYTPSNRKYLSGIISSLESFNFTHGYAEMRAKLPYGQGLWPAFWQFTTKYVEDVPEVDIMEMLGHDSYTVNHTYHFFDIENNWQLISTPTFKTSGPNFTDDFHTFGVMWEPKKLVWYVDGVAVKTLTEDDGYVIPKQAMYVIANLAVGGNWPGSPDASTPFPARYDIDYIKIYRKDMPTPVTPLVLNNHYQLMFEDDFNGTTVDTSKWNSAYLWGPYLQINNEEQIYIDKFGRHQNHASNPFTVSNGTLKIIADEITPAALPTQEPQGDSIWEDYPDHRYNPQYNISGGWVPGYTSGLLTSYDAFKFVHGYAEVRAKLPAGGGLWPAFWLLNAYYVGPLPEIDIMEMQGAAPDTIHHSYHYYDTTGNLISSADTYTKSSGDYTSGFHTYGLEWDRDYIKWYIDGQVTRVLENTENARQLMYVILNLAVGGNFVGPVTADFPTAIEIDYVRVYQLKNPDGGSGNVAPPYTLPANEWRIISVPSDLPAEQNTVTELFGDDMIGDYGSDWVIYDFNTQENRYNNVGVRGKLDRGKSYWIIQLTGNPVQLSLPNTSAIVEPKSELGCASVDCFPFQTTDPASSPWHMAGNPFDQMISIEDIRIVSDQGSCATGCTLTDASDANLIQPQIYSFNGTTYIQQPAQSNDLDAWTGFWLQLKPGAAGQDVKVLFAR